MIRRWSDYAGIGLAWTAGMTLLTVIVTITGWIMFEGLRSIDLAFLTSNPAPGSLEAGVAGGIIAPFVGTVIVVLFGMLVAVPVGIATALFLTEYRRPEWLAKGVDTAVDLIFGVPSIVFALFGLVIFSSDFFAFLSADVGTGRASARSFFVASLMMSLIGLPPVVRATQSAILSVPNVQREAAYALGKGRLATIRRIVIPASRPGISTGTILGMGRIAGDTAIVWLLLGGNVLQPPQDGWYLPWNWLDFLRNEGNTLTTYIYFASPAGEGNTSEKAYGAALILTILMFIVTFALLRVGRRRET